MKKFKCSCGKKTSSIRLEDGKTVCDSCKPSSLSGQWERRALSDIKHYEKDLLQAFNKDGTRNEGFVEAYGEDYYKKREKYKTH